MYQTDPQPSIKLSSSIHTRFSYNKLSHSKVNVVAYCGIIGTGSEGVPAGVEADTVDVRVVTFKHLDTLPRPHVPYIGHFVTTL